MPPAPSNPARTAEPSPLRTALTVLMFVAYLGALAAAASLSYAHLTDASLPGCGLQSACSQISSHPLGSIGGMARGLAAVRAGMPLLDVLSARQLKIDPHEAVIPTSLVATAFFAAMIVACLVWRMRSSSGTRARAAWKVAMIARVGAAGSLAYLGVILAAHLPCKYCLVAHACNLAGWVLVEVLNLRSRTMEPRISARTKSSRGASSTGAPSVRTPERGSWLPIAAGATAFCVALGALGIMDSNKRAESLAKAQAAQQESQAQMLAQAQKAKDAAAQAAPTGPAAQDKAIEWGDKGFQGRWRLGPELAVVRIVLFSDYQCHQCRRLEGEAMALQAEFPDKVSVSAFQFPLCGSCNPNMSGQCPHGNACWAARAAETAAIISGAGAALEGKDQWTTANDAFWKMHRWLFSQGGSFTDKSFPADLQKLGYNPQQFTNLMQTPQTLAVITQDIDKAIALGINGTPMVWVNGVELKGWEAPKALENAVRAILAAAPPAQSAKVDKPVTAREKYVADWRDERVRAIPPEQTVHALGAPDAPVQVLIYGDFLEPNTAKADAVIRDWVAKGSRPVRYTYRHFPGNVQCNPSVQRVIPGLEQSCLAARAAEAAFFVGGEDAYWRMHAWLLANAKGVSEQSIRQAAGSLGLDADKLAAEMTSERVKAAIKEDVDAAAMMGVGQIPCVFVNGKYVPRWTREGDDVLGRIAEEAMLKK